ncbi:hypothetical protein C8R46DRAFT_1207030 [Mycena filopes]|nr:hypothetical protein C8R46DRAFT_1207030 [Mycena filopes]
MPVPTPCSLFGPPFASNAPVDPETTLTKKDARLRNTPRVGNFRAGWLGKSSSQPAHNAIVTIVEIQPYFFGDAFLRFGSPDTGKTLSCTAIELTMGSGMQNNRPARHHRTYPVPAPTSPAAKSDVTTTARTTSSELDHNEGGVTNPDQTKLDAPHMAVVGPQRYTVNITINITAAPKHTIDDDSDGGRRRARAGLVDTPVAALLNIKPEPKRFFVGSRVDYNLPQRLPPQLWTMPVTTANASPALWCVMNLDCNALPFSLIVLSRALRPDDYARCSPVHIVSPHEGTSRTTHTQASNKISRGMCGPRPRLSGRPVHDESSSTHQTRLVYVDS